MRALPVIYNGEEFLSINKFDCINIELVMNKKGGIFCTSLPISRSIDRKHIYSYPKVQIFKSTRYVIFEIHDDWGTLNIMKIPCRLKDKIEVAKQCAVGYGLITKSELP